ncbi:MAG: hypothetical protein V7752_10260 [Halopseudomonas sp.]
MAIRRRSWITTLLILTLASIKVQAATMDQDPLNPFLLQQKLSLMQRMLENSSSTRRIINGDNPLAQQRLDFARDHVSVAEKAIASGQLGSASEKIEQAMKLYSTAAATVADATDKGDAQHTRFNELSVSIESFRLYVQKAVVQSNEPSPLDQQQLSSMMQLAAQLGQHQHYGEANDVLNEAYMLTITAVSALKGGTTIVYSTELDTPEQQYQYELERYKGLMQLYKMVIPEGKAPAKYNWTKKSLGKSEKAFNKANHLAKQSDYPQALEQLDQATKDLTKMLRLLGLPIS